MSSLSNQPSINNNATGFTLYDTRFSSRLMLGTANYPALSVLEEAVSASKPAMLTAAIRRQMSPKASLSKENQGTSFFTALSGMCAQNGCLILPNTAGCHSVQEAITTAQMARELFQTPWIKLELIGDDYTLQPDMQLLAQAAKTLIDEGFYVLPYCTEDLVACQRLLDVGCQVLMPWAAPIGTGKGPTNPHGLKTLRQRLPAIPLIVDAGLGLPSHAAQVMEWGFDGVLLNTAVSQAQNPAKMAHAFAQAVCAGRAAYQAGPMTERDNAQASTPVLGTPFWHSA